MNELNWRKSIEEVKEEISGGTRLPLLFFYRGSECEGSEKTLKEVLTDASVIKAIERETVPIKYDILKDVEIARRYFVEWTPTFIITDENGRELDRWVGYLPPEDFICQLTLSKGLAAFHIRRYEEAEREFEMLIDEHPESELMPEAQYFLGVTKFKETGDHLPLAEIGHFLEEKYPDSMWTKRASLWAHMSTVTRKPFVGYDQGGSAGSGVY